MENKKKFGSKSSIVLGIIVNFIVALGGLLWNIYLCSMDADEFDKYIMEYISTGTGASARSSGLVAVFYSNFGRIGCILFLLFCNTIVFYELFKEIQTLRRYLRKEKLFKQGLVSDMDDDEKPKGFIGNIRQLFSKSKPSSVFVSKYTRKELRKMKRELKEIEKEKRKKNS